LPGASRASRLSDLDEPTNHLDTGSIEWLEIFSRVMPDLLFVTHDRYFLDRVATRIVELSRGQFISYDGNLHRLPPRARATASGSRRRRNINAKSF